MIAPFKSCFKSMLRPLWRKVFPLYEKKRIAFKAFDVDLNKLLRGGENGIRAFKYAEITDNFLRPSTPVKEGPHVKLLKLYDQVGESFLNENAFLDTDYYKNAAECIQKTGSYFYDRPEKIKILAQRLFSQHRNEFLDLPRQPGQSDFGQPIWVRPIKSSSYYEVIDGNHRIARAIMRGDKTISAMVYEKEPVYTPLQQLLLDSLWINKKKWLYQPVDFPELKDEWILIRSCTDRLKMMQGFLADNPIKENKTYLDIASSYGWFVNEFAHMGFLATGMERDPAGMDVGFKVYGLKPEQIIHSDVAVGLEELIRQKKTYDVVSFLSILHHFVLHKSSTSAEDIIKLVDKVTAHVLFIDTGEEHETAFEGTLVGWNPEYIQKWILENTTFKRVIPLGIDSDRKPPFEGYYSRTLFACIR